MKTYHDLKKALANPEDVRELSVRKKKLKTLPDDIRLLKNVEKINLAYNSLNDLPPAFAELKNLKSLKLSNNNFHYLPEVLLEMPQLEFLNIRRNRLKSLPDDIHRITRLQTLIAYANQVKTLPQNFAKLKYFQLLNLSENPDLEVAQVFSVLAQLSQPFALELRRLDLQKLPDNFLQLSQLKSLDIDEATNLDIAHTIEQLEKLPNCTYLKMGASPAQFPKNLEKLTHLEGFSLYNHQENDHIDWGKFTQLKKLKISGRSTYHIPKWVWQLEHLEELDVSSMPLAELPQEMCQLDNLKKLNIHDVFFSKPPKVLNQLIPQLTHLESGLHWREAFPTLNLNILPDDSLELLPALLNQEVQPRQLSIQQLTPFLQLEVPHIQKYALWLIEQQHETNPLENIQAEDSIAFVGKRARYTQASIKKVLKSKKINWVTNLKQPIDYLVISENAKDIPTEVWSNANLKIVSDYQWQQWVVVQENAATFEAKEVQHMQQLLLSTDPNNHLLVFRMLSGSCIIPPPLYIAIMLAKAIHDEKTVQKAAKKLFQTRLPTAWQFKAEEADLWGTHWPKLLLDYLPSAKQQQAIDFLCAFTRAFHELALEYGGKYLQEYLEEPYNRTVSGDMLSIPNNIYNVSDELVNWEKLKTIKSFFLSSPSYSAPSAMQKIPSVVFKMPQLEGFFINHTLIKEIPSKIERLQNLNTLQIDNSLITSIPKTIQNLPKLNFLSLLSNRFEKFPDFIAQMSQLDSLFLGGNPLVEFPEWLQEMPQLTHLELSALNLNNIPSCIEQLQQLTSLHLQRNHLSQLSEGLFTLSSLKHLDLRDNQLTELAPNIGQLKNLDTLNLLHNQLSTLPKEIGQLDKLTYLYIDHNPITFIPDEMEGLVSLEPLVSGKHFD